MKVFIGKYPGMKSKKTRRIAVKIHDYDVWSLDNTLALIIEPALKMLQKSKHGAPLIDDEDVPEDLRKTSAPPTENEWDTDANFFKRWEYVLGEMIWAFERLNMDYPEEEFYHNSDNLEMTFVPIEGTDLSECVFNNQKDPEKDAYWVDTEGLAKYNARLRNGLRLFGVYFQSLWD